MTAVVKNLKAIDIRPVTLVLVSNYIRNIDHNQLSIDNSYTDSIRLLQLKMALKEMRDKKAEDMYYGKETEEDFFEGIDDKILHLFKLTHHIFDKEKKTAQEKDETEGRGL